jgi:PPP family 3-phenylpropionic acid transporter
MNFILHQALFFGLIVFTINTSFPVILGEYGYSSFEIGILLTISGLTNFILSLLFFKFTFKGEYLKFIYFFLFLFLLSTYVFIGNFYLTIINIFFLFSFYNLSFSYNDSMILEKYNKNFGRVRGIGSLFFVLMSVISYFIIDDIKILFIGMIIAGLFLFLNSLTLDKLKNVQQNIYIKIDYFIDEKFILLFYFFFNIGLGIFFSFYSLLLLDAGYSINQVFIIFGFFVFAETLMLFFQDKLIEYNRFLSIKNILILSIVLTILRFSLLQYYIDNYLLQILINSIHMFTYALLFTSLLFYFKKKYSDNHFVFNKISRGIGNGLGMTVGAFLGGILFVDFSSSLLYFAASFILISLFFIFFIDNV